MACKGSHVHSVVERRIRPIYEWLDSGNNKKALQECEKVLKKTSNLQCVKALKALSLLRLGKETECISILDALTLEKPSDEVTLQAMTLCYRELQQLEKICQLYEAAVKLEPNNEELLSHLFMSYVRISDFKSQQQTAMSLYKFKPKNPYYCWAVMSVILQATRGSDSRDTKKRSLLLSLAERMIDKLINDNKLDAEQEAQLYVMVLELQHKYEEILKVFNGPLGSKLINGSLQYNKLPYLMKLNNWHEVNLQCKKMLVDSVDKWDIWKEYISSVMRLMKCDSQIINNHLGNNCTNVEDDLETVDNTPEKAHEFICRLVENGTDNGYLLRGPYLARFELCSKLGNNNVNTTDLLGETVELFIEYFRKFGDRSCCVSDLRQYLKLLDKEKKSDLSIRLIKDVGISSTSVPQNIHQMQRHICALQLSRLCGGHRNLSIDHLRALVTAFSLHYQHGYQTYGTNLLVTDQGPSDPYALLAAHVLHDLYQSTKSSSYLILALSLLENLLKNSPSNFHAKLLCVKFYHCLGGALGAQTMYDSLDIKHLQLDSMGYIHCARLPTTGLYTIAVNQYATTVKFFSSNYKDSSDHLTFSYKFGSFLKLGEFMDFRERVNNSLHYTTISVERVLLNLVQCNSVENFYAMDMEPRDTPILWDKIIDNHDLGVYTSWDPVRIEMEPGETAEIRSFFDQNMKLLRLRHQIVLAMAEVIKIGKSTDGVRGKHLGNLMNKFEDWRDAFQTVRKTVSPPLTQNLLNMPLPSRLHAFLNAPYVEILGEHFKLIETVASDGEKMLESSNDIHNTMKNTIDNLSKMIDEQNDAVDFYWGKRDVMEYVVNVVEIFSMSSLLLAVCFDAIKVPHGKKTKRKSNDLKLREHLVEMTVTLKNHLANLDCILDRWKPSSSATDDDDLAEQLMALNLNADGHANVLTNLKNSHIIAIKELKTVLKSKSKLLDALASP